MEPILVPLSQGCEELEAVTIIDLLRRADLEVITAGLVAGPVKCSRGVVLIPDTNIDDICDNSFSMVVLPGGLQGANYMDKDKRIHKIIQNVLKRGGFLGAICAAPKVLANLGILEGKTATSFPGVLDSTSSKNIKLSDEPVVRDGLIVTSQGPGTAIDFSLELIGLLKGELKQSIVEKGLMRP